MVESICGILELPKFKQLFTLASGSHTGSVNQSKFIESKLNLTHKHSFKFLYCFSN